MPAPTRTELIKALDTAEKMAGDYLYSRTFRSLHDDLVRRINLARSSCTALSVFLRHTPSTDPEPAPKPKKKGKKDKKKGKKKKK